MKNGLILLLVTLLLFLSGCGVYALIDPAVTNPSPTPIAVATLAPPTAAATASFEPTAPVPVEEVQPTATQTSAATLTATTLPSPTFTAEPDWLAYSGRTEDGLMFLGNPEAP